MSEEAIKKDYDFMQGPLESLFVNNRRLGQITAYCNRFNPIKVMKMKNMEIRHSAILGWLLNPRETHGFGDSFLKAFLAQAMSGQNDFFSSALDIIKNDFSDAEIRLEWKNIDIFILSKSNNYAFVIENKFKSPKRKGQIEGYITEADNVYKQCKVYGIFLMLSDPEEEQNDDLHKTIMYEDVCEILTNVMQQNESKISVEVKTFLTHYLEIIEEECDMSEKKNEMKKLARELYLQHKSAIDFVIEHGKSTGFTLAFEEIQSKLDKDGYYWGGLTSDRGSFLPKVWHDSLSKKSNKWQGCEKWWMGFPLICWLQIIPHQDGSKGQLRLYAEVGPYIKRTDLIELIKNIRIANNDKNTPKIEFQKGAKNEGKMYSKFLKNNSEQIHDLTDSEEIYEKMKHLLNTFKPIFDEISQKIPEFLEKT